ncbi:MAG: hypothetical protein WDA53_01780 [Bacillota bacterium]
MQISGDLTLWLKSEGGTGQLKLETGEMVRALVKDVTSEQVVLLIKGQSVEAKAEADLVPGQRIQLKVQDNIDGRIVFQLLEGEGDSATGSSFGRISAEGFLARLGLALSENNILLAQALLEAGIDGISKEDIQLLARLLGANANKNDALALVQLFQKNLPLKNNHISSLASFLQHFNANATDGLGGKEAATVGLTDMLSFLDKGSELGDQLVINTKDGAKIGQKLSELVTKLGLEHEAVLQKSDLNSLTSLTKTMPSVKEALLSLLQGQELPVIPNPEVLEAARFLLQSITGLQIMNLGTAEEMQFYLMGWLNSGELNERENPFFLSFFQNKSGGQGPGDPAYQIMVKTGTPRLGSILSELRFFRNRVTIETTVDNSYTQKFFNQYQDKLIAMMEDLPWTVHILPCRLAEKPEIQQNWIHEYIKPSTAQNIDFLL